MERNSDFPEPSVLPSLVKKRCVFYFVGYELMPPTRIDGRLNREIGHFRWTWNVSAILSPPTIPCNGLVSWYIDSAGPNWQVRTQLVLFDWSDLVIADLAKPRWKVLLCGLVAIFDFLWSGTAVGYLRTNWRYLLFYVYPILLLSLLAAIGFVVARIGNVTGLPWAPALAPLLGIGCVVMMVHWAGQNLHLYYTLLNWSFAAAVVRRRRSELETKLDQFARAFVETVRVSAADEIVVFGYSLGAVMMMEVVARALHLDPQIARSVVRVNLLSVASSLLKIGLHPAAEDFRLAVRKVIEEPAIYWVEIQGLVDILSFYKTDPVAEMKLPACGKPIVRIARIRKMVTESAYRWMRWRPFRLHLQFTSGNERRYFYDFFMICCGPMPLPTRVELPSEQAVGAFAPDGTYLLPIRHGLGL
jgi:hypothetical protein